MLYFAVALTVLIAVLVLLYLLLQGAIFVPTPHSEVEDIISLSGIKKGEKVADLGSGDGRIVLAFAKKGAQADGFEINPVLVKLSRSKIKAEDVEGNARIHFGSFWRANLKQYDVVVVFGISYIMARLERKLRVELKPGARVIANIFPFPKWKYLKKIGGLYLYIN